MLVLLLVELAGSHCRGGVDDESDDVVGCGTHEFETQGEHEIAGHDGLTQGVLFVQCLGPSPHLSRIVDVVVDEGCVVDELHRRTDVDGLGGILSAEHVIGQDTKGGPDPLTVVRDDILAHFTELRILRTGGDGIHNVLYPIEFGRDAAGPVGCHLLRHVQSV